MAIEIDLNCDGGESFGIYQLGNDEAMMEHVTSISCGCGFHGGDPHVMHKTVKLAKKYNVGLGAHPGLPDPIGFGRRKLEITPREAKDYMLYQVGALKAFCDAYQVPLQHVKPHGQLYNMAWHDEALAGAIIESVRLIEPEPIFLALYGTLPYEMAKTKGLRVAGEYYADLDYAPDGTTFIKKTHGPIEVKDVVDKVIRMVAYNQVPASDGSEIEVRGESVCFHGDNPHSPEIVSRVKDELNKMGVKIAPLGEHSGI